MYPAHKQTGFTIVELLIVVVVIAILAAITIVSYNGIQNRTKQSAAQSAVAQASKKVLTYAVQNGDLYPPDLAATGMNNTDGLEYSYNNNVTPKTYGITSTKGAFSYYVSNSTPSPTVGSYAGHAKGGVAVITNLIANPSFENGTSGWTPSGNITLSPQSSGGLYGAAFHRGNRANTSAIGIYSPVFDVDSSGTYTGRMSARYAVNQYATLRFQFYNSAGTAISAPTSSSFRSLDVNSWQTLTYTVTTPAGTATARFDIVLSGIGAAAGDPLDIDGAMVTKGDTEYNYADGNTAGWVWNGTPNESSSKGLPQ